MKMIFLKVCSFCLMALGMIACDRNEKAQADAKASKSVSLSNATGATAAIPATDTIAKKTELIEHFVDSLTVGRKGKNKVELFRYRQNDEDSVRVNFYSRSGKVWMVRNTFRLEKDQIAGCDMMVTDMTGDAFKDMSYISNIAARGANEVRTLFIYDAVGDSLIHIKNSEDYPNMLYNKGLKCVDAFMVHGGCTTVFARIEKDSLKTFASVDLSDNRIVKIYDKQGKATVIRKDTILEFEFIRYKNYRPLQE